MTDNMEQKPRIKRESKNKIRVEFERTSLRERLKEKYLSLYFLKRAVWYVFRLLLLIGIAFVVVQPFLTMIIRSIMAPQDYANSTVVNVPRHVSGVIYKAIFKDLHYVKYFFTTFAVSMACALLQTFACSLIGYGLAKFKFRGNKWVFLAVIITLTIPHGSLQSAIYYRFQHLDVLGIFTFLSGGAHTGIGWLDNIFSKIHVLPNEKFGTGIRTIRTLVPLFLLSATGLAFKNGLYIFMLRQFFRGVPDELEESAYLDGANTFRTFIQVILPLSIPMMITVFLFAFCWQWTDDFYVELFFKGVSDAKKPALMVFLPPALADVPKSLTEAFAESGKSTKYNYALRYGCGLMASAPLIVVFLFCQKYLVQGIERSGIVG